jgi:hypothetical protein
MKTINKILLTVAFGTGLFVTGSAKAQTATVQPVKNPEMAAQLKSFVTQKVAQADAAFKAGGPAMPADFKNFFSAAEKGDWLAVSNAFLDLKKHVDHQEGTASPDFSFAHGVQWEAAKEIWGVFDAFNEGDEKYSAAFGNDVIASIPPGSIYFGGTDPGRFIVTALQKSQVGGDPFFSLTQNAFADGAYLDYLRSMYGNKIYVPTYEDSEKCFQAYKEDAQNRLQNHQLKPGEDVSQDSNGQLKISGQVAVMEINGLTAKVIFDKNTNRECYVEESYPLDWMYPHLEPHGLIMKINRQPLPELSDEIVRNDSDYWGKYVTPMIGGWLNHDTQVKVVADFAEKVYVQKDLSGFKGDPQFIQNEYSCRMFSKLRSSIAGLYAWRAQHATHAGEKDRMNDAADFAFRQAWALCPYSPEAVFRYVNLLLSENRAADALLVAKTAGKMPAQQGSDGEQMRGLIAQLKQYQTQLNQYQKTNSIFPGVTSETR